MLCYACCAGAGTHSAGALQGGQHLGLLQGSQSAEAARDGYSLHPSDYALVRGATCEAVTKLPYSCHEPAVFGDSCTSMYWMFFEGLYKRDFRHVGPGLRRKLRAHTCYNDAKGINCTLAQVVGSQGRNRLCPLPSSSTGYARCTNRMMLCLSGSLVVHVLSSAIENRNTPFTLLDTSIKCTCSPMVTCVQLLPTESVYTDSA